MSTVESQCHDYHGSFTPNIAREHELSQSCSRVLENVYCLAEKNSNLREALVIPLFSY